MKALTIHLFRLILAEFDKEYIDQGKRERKKNKAAPSIITHNWAKITKKTLVHNAFDKNLVGIDAGANQK